MVRGVALSVEHTDLGTAVTNSLREAIISGHFPAGSRLVETDLAKQLGVSRGPIRDALAELQRSGLVELRSRKGSFVRSLTADDVDEVYTLRTALESLAVRRAVDAPEHHPRLLTLLEDVVSAHEQRNQSAIGQADLALHRAIVESAGHSRLLTAWDQLADQTRLMMTNLSALDPEIQGPSGHHRTIVDRIADRDGDGAQAALVDHLEASRRLMIERFS